MKQKSLQSAPLKKEILTLKKDLYIKNKIQGELGISSIEVTNKIPVNEFSPIIYF
jgi:hypothetical protein